MGRIREYNVCMRSKLIELEVWQSDNVTKLSYRFERVADVRLVSDRLLKIVRN